MTDPRRRRRPWRPSLCAVLATLRDLARWVLEPRTPQRELRPTDDERRRTWTN